MGGLYEYKYFPTLKLKKWNPLEFQTRSSHARDQLFGLLLHSPTTTTTNNNNNNNNKNNGVHFNPHLAKKFAEDLGETQQKSPSTLNALSTRLSSPPKWSGTTSRIWWKRSRTYSSECWWIVDWLHGSVFGKEPSMTLNADEAVASVRRSIANFLRQGFPRWWLSELDLSAPATNNNNNNNNNNNKNNNNNNN